jgi:hypothetical protein
MLLTLLGDMVDSTSGQKIYKMGAGGVAQVEECACLASAMHRVQKNPVPPEKTHKMSLINLLIPYKKNPITNALF